MNDVTPEQLSAHRTLVKCFLAMTLLVAFVLSAFLCYAGGTSAPFGQATPILLIVALAGTLGGLANCLRRVFAFDAEFPSKEFAPLFVTVNLYVIAYALIPALVGMTAAAFVYILCAGKLLGGSLFPVFECGVKDACGTFAGIMAHWAPKDAIEVSKASAWGFIGGYSEHFIVDAIAKFTSSGAKKNAA